MQVNKFDGKKWRCVGERVKVDSWGYTTIVPEFQMTRSYRQYLVEAQKQKEYNEFIVLKNKLDYEYKTYGEVDEMDFNRYKAYLAYFANRDNLPMAVRVKQFEARKLAS